MMTNDKWIEIEALKSSQDEADTRMLLHAKHASNDGIKSVVVTPADTYVLILSLL